MQYIYTMWKTKASRALTDGLSDSFAPAWDASGKYIYFLSSINYGLSVGWLDMSSIERPLNYNVFMAVLDDETDSPLAPKSDDEEVAEEEDQDEEGEEEKEEDEDEEEKDEVSVEIDWERMDQRIISLDIPPAFYTALCAGRRRNIVFDGNQSE